MNGLLNPPKPPYEEPIDNAGRYKLLINENNGATLVEANGTETITLARISEGRLEDLSRRLSERLGQTR